MRIIKEILLFIPRRVFECLGWVLYILGMTGKEMGVKL